MARRLILSVLVTLLGTSTFALAQESEMTMAEYQARLAACRVKQAAADSAAQVVNNQIAQLREQIDDIHNNQIARINSEVLDLIDADSAAVRDYIAELDALNQQLRAMRQLSPDQIVDAREAGELAAIEARLADLRKNKIAALPESQQRIRSADQLIQELQNVQRPAPVVNRDEYTVVRGDYLWRIAGKPTVYGNPYEWVKIYSANQDLVGENPNLIYADWVLGVPRNQAPGTYWVQPGDNLVEVAKKVYGDASKWTSIYNANEDLIINTGGDQGTIFPHMVLEVPQQ